MGEFLDGRICRLREAFVERLMGKAIWLRDVIVGPEEGTETEREVDGGQFSQFIVDFKAWLLARYRWVCTGEFHLVGPSEEGEGEEERVSR